MRIGIIGAGVCGAYLSYKLSMDHDVTVFESKSEIGNKACSGLVSERLWDFIPKNDKLIKNKMKTIKIKFKNKEVFLDMNPGMMALERAELDKYVMSLSKAKLKLNARVTKIVPGVKPVIYTKKEKFEFDYVIGTDGAQSFTRKQLGGKDPKFNLGVLVYEKTKKKSNVINTWPLKNGFAWEIPRGDSIEYGVFENPKVAYQEFKKFYKRKPKLIHSALIPEGLCNVVKGNITLCGDSAGLAKPWSGGGIIWALQSADILLKNFPNLHKYDKELKEFFEPRIFFSKIISKTGVWFGNNLPFLIPKEFYFDSDWIF